MLFTLRFKRISKTNRVMATLIKFTEYGEEFVASKKFHYQPNQPHGIVDDTIRKWAEPIVKMHRLLLPDE